MELLILGLIFIIVTSLIMIVAFLIRKKDDPAVKRIQELQNSPYVFTNVAQQEEMSPTLEKQWNERIEQVLEHIGQFIKQNDEKLSRLRQQLIQAGYRQPDAVRRFVGIKTVCAVICFLLCIYLGTLGDKGMGMVMMMSGLMAFVGYRIPDLVLGSRIRKRQEQIAEGLPDALDLMVISVEAGLGLNAAILRVGQDLQMRSPAFSQELMRVNHDLRTGIAREEALRNLSNRNNVDDLRILVSALILADRLGTSIADTLRIQADSLRTRIKQKAEEQAAKAGIKMLFPLVAFILPALIAILMGPGLIAMYRTFFK